MTIDTFQLHGDNKNEFFLKKKKLLLVTKV